MTSEEPPSEVVHWLSALARGETNAKEELFPLIYSELHRLATGYMRRERPDHTLQPTALVHEAYLRLVKSAENAPAYKDRQHFIATAATAMRHILVNHAKAREAKKRTGNRDGGPLQPSWTTWAHSALDLLALDEALRQLAELSPVQAQIVELHFFGGMSFDECAVFLDLSPRTIYYEWSHARAWLRSKLDEK